MLYVRMIYGIHHDRSVCPESKRKTYNANIERIVPVQEDWYALPKWQVNKNDAGWWRNELGGNQTLRIVYVPCVTRLMNHPATSDGTSVTPARM